MASRREFEEATARGFEELRRQPRAVAARYDPASNLVVVDINTGYSIAFPPSRSQALSTASPEQLQQIVIDYPGYTLYFPRLDDGILISSLAKGRFGSDRWEAAWLAAHPLELNPFPEAYLAQGSDSSSARRTIEAA